MSEIVQNWIQNTLHVKAFEMKPPDFPLNVRNGYTVAKLLYAHDIITSEQLDKILPCITDDAKMVMKNLKFIRTWLQEFMKSNISEDEFQSQFGLWPHYTVGILFNLYLTLLQHENFKDDKKETFFKMQQTPDLYKLPKLPIPEPVFKVPVPPRPYLPPCIPVGIDRKAKKILNDIRKKCRREARSDVLQNQMEKLMKSGLWDKLMNGQNATYEEILNNDKMLDALNGKDREQNKIRVYAGNYRTKNINATKR